jgi:hypothetical protein
MRRTDIKTYEGAEVNFSILDLGTTWGSVTSLPNYETASSTEPRHLIEFISSRQFKPHSLFSLSEKQEILKL